MAFFSKHYKTLNTLWIEGAALKHNLNYFREKMPGTGVAPVLKGNAYGHGLKKTAEILKSENCPFYIVDSNYEAYQIRKVDKKTPILILGFNYAENIRKKSGFTYAAGSLDQCLELIKHKVPFHLEINSGMNRMGFSLEELEAILPQLKEHKKWITGVFTHLADADNPSDDSFTQKQVAIFNAALKKMHDAGLDPQWIHVANSAGALKTKSHPFNMIRLGLGLYGITPYENSDPHYKDLEALKPVLEFESTLVQIQDLKAGDCVGYGHNFEADRPMRIGVLCAGYYEGVPIALSKVGFASINGEICRILGRVCMNHTFIELNNAQAKIGDKVVLYSKDFRAKNSIHNQAKVAGTIPYELVTRLAESIKRKSR